MHSWHKRLAVVLVTFASGFLPSMGLASEVQHEAMRDIMQKAVLKSPEVLSKWHAYKAAAAEENVQRGPLLPRADLTAGVGRERLQQPGTAEANYTRSGYQLTLSQLLYDGFSSHNDWKRFGRARLTRYFELLDAAEAIALEAARAYYDVMRYRYLFSLVEQNYIEHRAVFEQLMQRAQTGAGRRVDVEHAESRLALAEINLATEQANLHDVTARYMRLLDEPPAMILFGPARMEKDYPKSAEEALQLAFRHNPALRAAVENVEAAQLDLEARRGAMGPRLDFRLRAENARNQLGVIGGREQQVAELVLNYNLYNGGADTARLVQYAERKNLAFDLREKACRDARQTLVIAYNDVRRLRAQLGYLGVQVGATEKTRDAYRAQFNIGQRSLLDVLDTENELLTARRTEINAEMDLSIAYLRTQAGIGRLLTSFGLRHAADSEGEPGETEFTPVPVEAICAARAPTLLEIDNNTLTEKALRQIAVARPGVAARGQASAASPAPSLSKPESAGETPLRERLAAWANAWSARDVDAYLAFYATGFTPEKGADRAAWEAQRRSRLRGPSHIRVALEAVEVTLTGESANVRFLQDYSSDRLSEQTAKSLDWVRENGEWRIRRERSLSAADRPPPVVPAASEPAKSGWGGWK